MRAGRKNRRGAAPAVVRLVSATSHTEHDQTHEAAPPRLDRLIRPKDVAQYAGLSKTQLAAKVASGEFPRPVPLSDGGRAVAWLASEIAAWQAERKAAREKTSSRSRRTAPVARQHTETRDAETKSKPPAGGSRRGGGES